MGYQITYEFCEPNGSQVNLDRPIFMSCEGRIDEALLKVFSKLFDSLLEDCTD